MCTGFQAAYAQIGGTTVYNFLNFQPNARITALGGYAIATPDDDINLAVQNPSLLRKEMSNQITYNYVRFVSDIGSGYAGYAHHFDSIGTFAVGMQYINYGNFTRASDNGEVMGSFTAGEYNFQLSYARRMGPFSLGGTFKVINSNLDVYQSVGLAIDAAGTYYNAENLVTVSGVISNMGAQITTYRDNNRESLPLNVQLGVSKKFLHNPLRLSLVAHNLESAGKLLYRNDQRPGVKKDLETGTVINEKYNVFEKGLAHLNVSAEILLGKFMYVGFGYSDLRRHEMKLENTSGLAGFSWGFGLRFKKFQLAYGSAAYHAAYSTNNFSFIVYMNEFRKKQPPKETQN